MSIVVRDLHWPVILNHSQCFEQPSWILGGHLGKIFNRFNFLFSFVSSISAPKMKILPLKLKKKIIPTPVSPLNESLILDDQEVVESKQP